MRASLSKRAWEGRGEEDDGAEGGKGWGSGVE